MGTLGKQPARTGDNIGKFEDFLEWLQGIADSQKVPLATVVAAHHAFELHRQNSIAKEDGDYRDEQMGGLGAKLGEIAAALERLADT